MCEGCLEGGCHAPVQEVHHVLPREYGCTRDFDNLRLLCNCKKIKN
ncbi:HNH endonuclease [Arcanobacterium phocae]